MPKGYTGTTQEHYLDYKSASLEQLYEFFDTKDLCKGQLSPISTNLETFSLSQLSLNGEYDDRIEKIPEGIERSGMIREGCLWLQNLAHKYFLAGMAKKFESVEAAPGEFATPSSLTQDIHAYKRWIGDRLSKMENSPTAYNEYQGEGIAGNHTVGVVSRHVRAAQEISVADSYEDLMQSSMEIAKRARLLVDNGKTFLGIMSSVEEWRFSVVSVFVKNVFMLGGQLSWPLPTFQWHDHFGRHWDVLQTLMERFEHMDRPIRFAEVGMACAPISLFMLQRFPNLEYVGIDPSISTVTQDRILRYDRAILYRNISEEIAPMYADGYFDLVFVDGPHTFKNVQNDIALWNRKVREGGILGGHDFTANHPPLLAAVISMYWGGHINLAMDGVWWWDEYPRF
eukprot:gene428-900_t